MTTEALDRITSDVKPAKVLAGYGAATATQFYSNKITDYHWERFAVVYVRQSTQQQVLENRESTARQYALVDRAVALGWSRDRILVIDEDQGRSGQTAEGRLGFQRLLLEVNLDHVGLILGLEMSRLARSSKDWHHLLEVCAVFHTLLADQDGLYEPNDPNDRLLLGLKGTLSEAEMHTLRTRLLQGKLHKAKRGELFVMVPTGYTFAPSGEVILDPDEQVQAVVRLIFEKFEELGTVAGVTAYLNRHKINLGFRKYGGVDRGQLEWRRAQRATILDILHHPIYAGAYSYGRRRVDPRHKKPGQPRSGRIYAPLDAWHALKKDCHPAYISWAQYEDIQSRITDNRAHRDARGAPRKGHALLGSLLRCGRCGLRMAMNYERSFARYYCPCQNADYGRPPCQSISARVVDDLITRQVFEALEPAALELSFRATEDIQRERDRSTKQWRQRLERAEYNQHRAERQYQSVEPENRLVARELERRWEQTISETRCVQDEYDHFLRHQPAKLTAAERDQILALSKNIPEIWQETTTTPIDRKHVVRQLIEKVVLNTQGDSEVVDVTIQWAGGFVSQLQICRPVRSFEQLQGFSQMLDRIHELRNAGRSYAEIARQLNQEGYRSPRGKATYTNETVRQLLSRHKLIEARRSSRPWDKHLGKDEWSIDALANKLGIPSQTLYNWCKWGWVSTRRLSGGTRPPWVCWADAAELGRLDQPRKSRPKWPECTYPKELTTPRKSPFEK